MFEVFESVFRKYNGFDKNNGLEFKIHAPGKIEYKMKIEKHHLSTPTAGHGGAIAGMMDCVLGLSALTSAFEDKNFVSTVEFKINYLGPTKLGDELSGVSHIDFKGKSLIVSSGEIKNLSTNKVVAKGMGTFNVYPMEKNKDFMKELEKHGL